MQATRGRSSSAAERSEISAKRLRIRPTTPAPASTASSAAATRRTSSYTASVDSAVSETMATSPPIRLRTAASTSGSETAHTSHRSWVTTTSGDTRFKVSSRISYTDRACWTISLTSMSISRLLPSSFARGRVHTGSASTPAGKSHSWERPTSESRWPTADTISVALGSRETIRGGVDVMRVAPSLDGRRTPVERPGGPYSRPP